MNETPRDEHHWLQQRVGEWTFESECAAGPGEPPARFRGSERVYSLGGLWIVAEGQGEMPGGGMGHTRITLGFDPQRGRYTGTFVGSMMSFLWVYDGALDAAGRVLTLDTTGPDFVTAGKLAKYQDLIALRSPDHRVLSSQTLGEDGQWRPFMTAHYRRA